MREQDEKIRFAAALLGKTRSTMGSPTDLWLLLEIGGLEKYL